MCEVQRDKSQDFILFSLPATNKINHIIMIKKKEEEKSLGLAYSRYIDWGGEHQSHVHD